MGTHERMCQRKYCLSCCEVCHKYVRTDTLKDHKKLCMEYDHTPQVVSCFFECKVFVKHSQCIYLLHVYVFCFVLFVVFIFFYDFLSNPSKCIFFHLDKQIFVKNILSIKSLDFIFVCVCLCDLFFTTHI